MINENFLDTSLLLAVSFLVPMLLYRVGIRSYMATIMVSAGISIFLYSSRHTRLLASNPQLSAYEDLKLCRGYTGAELKQARRHYSLAYHPDRAANETEKLTRISKFQQMENQISVLSHGQKRELLDRFNHTLPAAVRDQE